MSLQITVEDGRRQRLAELGDTSGALDKLGALGTGLLAGVDPYGHTMFNRRQLSLVIAELETYSRSADLSAEQAGFVSKLVMLVRRYEEEPHVYLWFYGDWRMYIDQGEMPQIVLRQERIYQPKETTSARSQPE